MPSFWASFVNSLGVATASMVALLWGLVIVGFFAWVYQEINLTGTEQKRRRFPCAVSSISNEIEEERDGAIDKAAKPRNRTDVIAFRRGARELMAPISLSSLRSFGLRVTRYCRVTLESGFSSAFRQLMMVVEANHGRIASSTIRALSDARPSAGQLFCFALNILFITAGAELCISGYGFATGLCFFMLALAPALMLLNIAFTAIEEESHPSPLGAFSTNRQAAQRTQTLDEKTLSIVPEKFETALDESGAARQELRKAESHAATRQ